mgnify:CR=1 FL=1
MSFISALRRQNLTGALIVVLAATIAGCGFQPMHGQRSNASATTQYLVIGDSISMGMNADLSALVAADGWALTHNPGNAASSNLGDRFVFPISETVNCEHLKGTQYQPVT